jgi:hypothetical protein
LKTKLITQNVHREPVDIFCFFTPFDYAKFSTNEPKLDFNHRKHHKTLGGQAENLKTNEHGIAHRRGFTSQAIQPIPDLRSGLNSPPSSAGSGRPPFQGQ